MSYCDCDHCKDIREQYYVVTDPESRRWDVIPKNALKWAEVGPKLLKELITAKHEMACTMLCLLQDDPCGAKSMLRRSGHICYVNGSPTFPSEAIREAEAI